METSIEDFELGDRVRVNSKTLDNGKFFQEEGEVIRLEPRFLWPVLVKLDNDELNGLVGGVLCSPTEVEYLGESADESEASQIERLKEELEEEKMACLYITAYADEWETIADEWRERYEGLKNALAVLAS